MEAYFLDTNIILRFLARDQEKEYKDCRQLFEKVKKGKVKLVTSSLVVFEVIWTLDSYYQVSKEKIINKIIALLGLFHLEAEHKEIFLEALVLWQHENIEFNDAFNYVFGRRKKLASIYSYDKDFDKLTLLPRREP